MKRILALIMVFLIGLGGSQALAIEKAPKKSKKDTLKAAPSEKIAKKKPVQKKRAPKIAPAPRKDEFIDKDGDGINDSISKRKPPEVKKERIPKQTIKRQPKPKAPIQKEPKKKEPKKSPRK